MFFDADIMVPQSRALRGRRTSSEPVPLGGGPTHRVGLTRRYARYCVATSRKTPPKKVPAESMNGRPPRLPGVPTRGVSVASSAPRPCERRTSDDGLLASAPDPVPSVNRDGSSLRTAAANRCPRRTRRLRWLPRPAPVYRTRSGSVPAQGQTAGVERGLTPRPGPSSSKRVVRKWLPTPEVEIP